MAPETSHACRQDQATAQQDAAQPCLSMADILAIAEKGPPPHSMDEILAAARGHAGTKKDYPRAVQAGIGWKIGCCT